jgi:hypothetical protein
MPLIATAGGTTSNAYCTVAEAYTLLSSALHPELVTDPSVIAGMADALIWATSLIEDQVAWYGLPVTTTQALSWPQAGMVTPRGLTLSSTTIPAFLQEATARYALALLVGLAQRTAALATEASLNGLKSLTIADVRMEAGAYSLSQTTQSLAQVTRLPADIRRLLRPYGDVAGDMAVPLRAR